ncbi:MAG: hypothetical protein NZM31_00070 [Gemmatales bacterium]|nr:hypothetical protein [Gemmatales bacterium]MDW8385388.1 hypothetical protein [Gemmatales bacterium]
MKPEQDTISYADLDESLRQCVEADVNLLARAASRLRWLGWFWFFTFGVMIIFSLAFAGVGKLGIFLIGGILGLILIGISTFYFALATYVARGHRWAIALALVIVSLFIALLLWRLLSPRPMNLPVAVLETLYLLGTLGLFKSLLQSWGAAGRITRFMQCKPVVEYGMVEDGL